MNKEPIEEIICTSKVLKYDCEHNNNLLVNESGIEEARRLLKITGISLELKKKGILMNPFLSFSRKEKLFNFFG